MALPYVASGATSGIEAAFVPCLAIVEVRGTIGGAAGLLLSFVPSPALLAEIQQRQVYGEVAQARYGEALSVTAGCVRCGDGAPASSTVCVYIMRAPRA